MKEAEQVVKTAEGDSWPYTLILPETLDEAESVYSEEGALMLLNAGLKVKQQNIARDAYRREKTREEVDELVRAYRPGSTRTNIRVAAFEAILAKAHELDADPDFKSKVKAAYKAGKFKDVIELLG